MREAMAEQEWVDVMQLLPVFGTNSRLAFEYVEKFSIHPMTIKVKKILRLLTDLAGLFKTGKFVINRLEYEVSQRGIVEALTEMNNRNFEQPLVNHNYLKKVLTSIAEKERTDRRASADAALQRNEKRTRMNTERTDQSEKPQCGIGEQPTTANDTGFLSAEENRMRAKELVAKIGQSQRKF
jgi:hypothetical protein